MKRSPSRRFAPVIEQMRGNYKVKNEGIGPNLQARMLVMQIGDVSFEHVRPKKQGSRSPQYGMDGNT
jgi:hypothetical protein